MWENLSNITVPNYNFSDVGVNLSNYPAIQNLTNLSSVEKFFTPVYWWTNVLGNWFYALLLFVTVGMVYVKTNSVFSTSLVMLLMSATMIVLLPYEAGLIVYLALVLSLAGVLYSLIGED